MASGGELGRGVPLTEKVADHCRVLYALALPAIVLLV